MMVVKRVADLDIIRRKFITAINGNIDDSFVGGDLCEYTFEQQLYLYLRATGYDRILFYTRAQGYSLYSFDHQSLATLFPCSPNTGVLDGRPLGGGRLKRPTSIGNNQSHTKEGKTMNGRKYYYVSNFEDSTLVKTVQDVMRDRTQKTVMFFSSLMFSLSDTQGFVDGIAQINNEFAAAQSENKLLFKYQSSGIFKADFFVELLKFPENVFTVGSPDNKECNNWINSQRVKGLIDGKTVFGFPFDTLSSQMGSQYKRIIEMNTGIRANRENFIKNLHVEEFSEELLSRFLSKIHGQEDNIEVIIKKVVTWVNRPDEYKVPLNFMFAGTSGTGKTYTAEMICKALESQRFEFVKLPMNEYKSEADVWKLLGSPAGYSGSDKDTPLIAAHKRTDKLVIYFDEMEKAHPSIFETIMTLMEKGELTNGSGERFDFHQSIIIFTTNLAMDNLIKRKRELVNNNVRVSSNEFQKAIKDILKQNNIKTEICGRINTVLVYNPLDVYVVSKITIEEIRKLGHVYNLQVNNIPETVLREISQQVADSNEGARPITTLIVEKMENLIQTIKKSNSMTRKEEHGHSLLDMVDLTEQLKFVSTSQDHLLSAEEIISQYPNLTKTPKTVKFNKGLLIETLKSVKGQNDNIKIIVEETYRWIRKVKKNKPLVFMFAGTSGTGKTYTAENICCALKNYRMVKLNMNEYHNEGDCWKLLGSSPGYIGSDQESTIFSARRETPNLVILFDEIEKAHPSLFTTIMTLMEKGEMANGQGETFDFKNAIVIFTTNLAMNELLKLKKVSVSETMDSSSQEFQDEAKRILKSAGLKDEISGRLDWLLVYNTLDESIVAQLALEKVRKLGKDYGISINRVPISYLENVAQRCAGNNEGARPINRIVTHDFEPIFQDAYDEMGDFDSDNLYDINEENNIIPSKERDIIPVEEIVTNIGLTNPTLSASIPNAPVIIRLPSEPFFENSYSYDGFRKATGLIKIDNGTGSGFLISPDGYILTCAHCTETKKITFVKDDDKMEYEATVIYKNEQIDIAILKIDCHNMPYLFISDSVKPLKIGDEIVILGYPSGTDISRNVSAFEGKVSNLISGNNTYITDAVAAPGSSGGALIAKNNGKVYGILKGGFKETLGVDINVSTDVRNLYNQNDIVIEYQ